MTTITIRAPYIRDRIPVSESVAEEAETSNTYNRDLRKIRNNKAIPIVYAPDGIWMNVDPTLADDEVVFSSIETVRTYQSDDYHVRKAEPGAALKSNRISIISLRSNVSNGGDNVFRRALSVTYPTGISPYRTGQYNAGDPLIIKSIANGIYASSEDQVIQSFVNTFNIIPEQADGEVSNPLHRIDPHSIDLNVLDGYDALFVEVSIEDSTSFNFLQGDFAIRVVTGGDNPDRPIPYRIAIRDMYVLYKLKVSIYDKNGTLLNSEIVRALVYNYRQTGFTNLWDYSGNDDIRRKFTLNYGKHTLGPVDIKDIRTRFPTATKLTVETARTSFDNDQVSYDDAFEIYVNMLFNIDGTIFHNGSYTLSDGPLSFPRTYSYRDGRGRLVTENNVISVIAWTRPARVLRDIHLVQIPQYPAIRDAYVYHGGRASDKNEVLRVVRGVKSSNGYGRNNAVGVIWDLIRSNYGINDKTSILYDPTSFNILPKNAYNNGIYPYYNGIIDSRKTLFEHTKEILFPMRQNVMVNHGKMILCPIDPSIDSRDSAATGWTKIPPPTETYDESSILKDSMRIERVFNQDSKEGAVSVSFLQQRSRDAFNREDNVTIVVNNDGNVIYDRSSTESNVRNPLNGPDNPLRIKIRGWNDVSFMRKLATFLAKNELFNVVQIAFEVPYVGFAPIPGDVIAVTHAMLTDYDNNWIVDDVSIKYDKHVVTLKAHNYDTRIHDGT